MSASDVIGTERLEALLRGEAPRTSDEARRHALLGGDLREARPGTERARSVERGRGRVHVPIYDAGRPIVTGKGGPVAARPDRSRERDE